MKRLFVGAMLMALVAFGCSTTPPPSTIVNPEPVQAEVKITIVQEGENTVAIKAEGPDGERIMRSMEVHNPGLKLSQLSAISNNKLFIKIFSGLSVADVTRMWNDMIYLENETGIKEVEMFIDSPGGDAFSGLALADTIEKYQQRGFHFTAHATGIIASAAVPVFSVCDVTYATPATIFMVHEAALWKWPGRESASDIRAQSALMDLLQKLYLEKLIANSAERDAKGKKIDMDYWMLMEAKTSWFSVTKAKELGILDHVDGK